MLKREKYRGIYEHGVNDRIRKGGRKITKADPSQVLRIEVPEWRIVDDETWLAAQEIMKSRTRDVAQSDRATKYALSGKHLSTCKHCGGPIGVVGGSRAKSYGCIRHHIKGTVPPAGCAVTVRRPVAAVEAAMADAVRTVLERPDLVEVLLDAYRAELSRQEPKRKVDIRALEKEVKEMERQEANLLEAIALGRGKPAALAALAKALDKCSARIQTLKVEIATARRTPAETKSVLAAAERTLRTRLADVRKVFAAEPEKTREFYQQLFPAGLVWTADRSSSPHRWGHPGGG